MTKGVKYIIPKYIIPKYQSVVAAINRTTKRVLYYEKIKAAVEAGYLIVPNFPIDVFAVRVKRAKQREATATYEYRADYKTAKAELLPAGEGRYVDDTIYTVNESYDKKLPDGKNRARQSVPLWRLRRSRFPDDPREAGGPTGHAARDGPARLR
jgi:hypothetical protein